MAVIHISEAEAARDLAGVLAQVQAGAEIVIDSGGGDVALTNASLGKRALISETVKRLKASAASEGEVYADPDFAKDIEEIRRNRTYRTYEWD